MRARFTNGLTGNGTTSSVFVDGVSVQTPQNHSNVNTTGTTGRIGASSFQFAYFMTGQLDEVRMMDSAMSADRVTAEFRSQQPSATFIKTIAAPVAAADP